MMDLEFSFDKAPWEDKLLSLQSGDTIAAVELLTLLEGEAEDAVQNVLLELEVRGVTLDISGLPKEFGNGEGVLAVASHAHVQAFEAEVQ